MNREHSEVQRDVWRKKISAEGEISTRGSFAFVLLESSCWFTTRGKRYGVGDEETSEMRVRQEFKIRL